MALTIKRLKGDAPVPGIMADRKLWLTADKSRVVEDGDADAAILFATPGWVIPEREAQYYGLLEGEADPDVAEPSGSSVLAGLLATPPVSPDETLATWMERARLAEERVSQQTDEISDLQKRIEALEETLKVAKAAESVKEGTAATEKTVTTKAAEAKARRSVDDKAVKGPPDDKAANPADDKAAATSDGKPSESKEG